MQSSLKGNRFAREMRHITLAERAKEAGAGVDFSVAVVFACCEYESWLLGGIESLAGKSFPNGQNKVKPDAKSPEGNLEDAPRNAKGHLSKCLVNGYSIADQQALTEMMNPDAIRAQDLRSFRRMENAVTQLVEAIRGGKQITSPAS